MSTGDLVYYPDSEPGIRRMRRGKGYSFIAPDGALIKDSNERSRLLTLAVPPAYEDVWMCPLVKGHLQATGRDARGRKQYLYHPDWTRIQAEAKFDNLVTFGNVLPRIRRRVQNDLSEDLGDQEFALAAAVTLIDRTSLRVGNPQYVEENGSFGALTLRNRHVSLSGSEISLNYSAKGGQKVRKRITDRKLARVLGKINDLPGATLLGWTNDEGDVQDLRSETLNAYISEAAGEDGITAKTFRTWAGTCAAYEIGEQGEATIKDMAEAAAQTLHNTPKIARDSYIHPAVIALAGEGAQSVQPKELHGLKVAEQRLLGFLEAST